MNNEDLSGIEIAEKKAKRKWWVKFFSLMCVIYFFTFISSLIKVFQSETDYLAIAQNLSEPIPFLILVYGYANSKRYFNRNIWMLVMLVVLTYDFLYYIFPLLSVKALQFFTSDTEILTYLLIVYVFILPIGILQYYCAYKYIFKSEDIWGSSNQSFNPTANAAG